jgi:serine/threonine protein kinase
MGPSYVSHKSTSPTLRIPFAPLAQRREITQDGAAMAEVNEGDILAGKYRVERILGEGGMGFVVAATHITLDERVALKFMRAEALMQQDGVQRFLREARAAVKLKSAHVARVLDVGTLESGAPYIVMEHLEGQDLAHLLVERGALPLTEVVDYVLQACDAIAEAHARGIIHRDLKPANVFVTRGRDGAPLIKVLDFGISKVNVLGDRPESMTSSATLLGSPVYMSPEQMKSSRDVDATADIWSLGIILYEAVGGRVPFDEQTMGALMAKVLTEPPPPLGALRPDLPTGFVDVVGRCLEKDPARRFTTIAELAVGLAPFGVGTDERVARIVAMGTRPSELPASMLPASTSALQNPSSAPQLGMSASSSLAVAATQLHSSTASEKVPPAPRSRVGLYATIGLVGVVVAAAAFIGTRSTGKAPSNVAPATAAAASDTSEPTPPGPSTSSIAPATTPAPSAPATAVAAAPSAEPQPSAAPRTIPATVPHHASHAAASATSKNAAATDPFGSSRQ